jgi:hypothetical protein
MGRFVGTHDTFTVVRQRHDCSIIFEVLRNYGVLTMSQGLESFDPEIPATTK